MEKRFSIFMVDDDLDDQELFVYIIGKINPAFTCTLAKNGLEALEKLEEGLMPDIIFLDINMPKMDGKEFLKRIKRNDRWKEIPVVIQSTAKNPDIEKEMLVLGADLFISKKSDLDKQQTEVAYIIEKFSNNK